MMKFPESVETPMIMIGPGTGITPFIGFIEERQQLLASEEADKADLCSKLGYTRLYFGCRKPDSDFIFKDILQNCVENAAISELNIAYSKGSEISGHTPGDEYV